MLRLNNQETPSRILRRIKEAENDSDMPSLPSMASIDNSDEQSDEDGGGDNASVARPGYASVADITAPSTSSSAGRRGLRQLAKEHQNTANNNNSSNSYKTNSAGRNILSPLKLNGRSSPATNSPSADNLRKGKGKASSYSNSKASSPGPLSAVSSNRTVRPASQSPHDFRASSITPSGHITSRANKPSRRTQAISFDDSLPAVDHSSAQNDTQGGPEPSQSLNLDFTEDSGFPERPHLETSIWSKRSQGDSSHQPTPNKKTSHVTEVSPESVDLQGNDVNGDNVSLPERNDNTYDYTTGFPTAANDQYTRHEGYSQRRGSSSSSASGSASEIPQIQVTPAPAPMARARRVLIRTASFDRAEESIGTTPGIGRRLPSAERRNDTSVSYLVDTKLIEGNADSMNDTTPSRSTRTTPTSSMPVTAPSTAMNSRSYLYSNTPEALTTPRPSGTDADLERRKMHLLSTLRMTALNSTRKGVRLARGTPHPRDRRARSMTPGAGQQDEDSTAEFDASARNSALGEDLTAMSGSSTLSDGSSNDLTTHQRGHGNTSLPLAGPGLAGEGGIVGASRFNNAKLNNYLHTLNTHLTTENQTLIKTLEETAKEVSRLMRKNEELSRINGSDDLSASPGQSSMSRITEDDEGNATKEMLRSHRKTSQDISTLRDHLTGNTPAKPSAEIQEEIREKDARLERLQVELEQRDAEIAAMRADLLGKSRSANGDDTTTQDAESALQQQVFDLRDELSRLKAENTLQSSDLAKARSEQVEQSSRHSRIMAELQERTNDLIQELEEKEAIIEEIENELVKQEEDFRLKMSNLEEELCKVMEEQEVQLREARKEIQSLRQGGNEPMADDVVIQDLRNKITALEQEREELRQAKTKAEAMLQEATATIAHTSSTEDNIDGTPSEQLAFLQKRINDLEADLAQKQQQLSISRNELAEVKQQHEVNLQNLRQQANEAEDNQVQTERRLASQAVLLKETEKAFTDSEDILRQTAEDLDEARRQLQHVHNEISDMKSQQLDALSSDLQKKYDAAVREIGNLKHQLAYPPPSNHEVQAGKYSKHDSRDIEIKTLRSSNHELESRVNQLRKQAMLAGQSPNNRSVSSLATPGRAEKSVRFDSVLSMKTPKTASQLLGGMSWLDKTGNSSGANATASPLYAEIDVLNRDIRQYQHLLQSANDEIDDKLRKLDGAGNNVISMARELEEAKRHIRELESGSAGTTTNSAIIQELRAVRDELTNERSSLMRRLKDIQEQCHQMALQLDASRLAESEAQRKLDWQTSQLHRLQGRDVPFANGETQLCLDPSHQDLAAERDAIFAGVAALKRDLTRVQQDALDLGQDLQAARTGGPIRVTSEVPGSSTCTKTSCLALQARSKQEAKGLLLMISHLKAKFTRESYYRADLAHQKLYLSLRIEQKEKKLCATNLTLARFGLPPPQEEVRPRMTLKIAGHAVIAIIRMEKLSKEWKKQSAVKSALRDAYKHTRGKPFVPAP